MSVRKDIILEALNKFSGKPKQTIAKWLHEKHPIEFKNVSVARSAIRYYTGSIGKHNRKSTENNGIETNQAKDSRPLKLPQGIKQSKPHVFIKKPGTYLITGDWHVPYHCHKSLEAMFDFAIKHGCEHFYGNGDLVDFYKSSRWCKDPRARCLKTELDTLHEILDAAMPSFPGDKYFKIGNHEDRFTRRIWESTPELAVLNRFDVSEVLEVKDRGFRVIHSTQFSKFNSLWLVHGHELAKGAFSPVNVARGVFLRAREAAATSHWHRTSNHIESGGMSKKLTTCHSIGCMCDLRPEYATTNNWNHGFAIIRIEGKDFHFENYTVHRGKVYST